MNPGRHPTAQRLVGLALGALACSPSRPMPAPGSPDVIIFTVDTLRADRLGFAGHSAARTPRLDAFAASATVFTDATTPLTRTTPALASLLSGTDPRGHGSWEVGAPLDPSVQLLSEALHAAGWATLGLSGTPVASPKQGFDRGFDAFVVLEDPPATELVARALELVQAQHDDRPVFLWVHVVDPHFPYDRDPDFPAVGPTERCDALGRSFRKKPRQRWRIFTDQDGRSSAALAQCQAAYDAEIARVDTAFGQLLDGLGPRADGWVVVSADHGENQGEGGLWYEHGPDASDATLRIPMVVGGPGVKAGVDHGPARLQDIAPTVLARLGLPGIAGPYDGANLFGTERPEAAAGVSASALHVGLTGYLRSGRGHKRSCLNVPEQPVSWCTDGAFDRASDPALKTPATPDPALQAALEAAAERWPPEQTRQWVARTRDWKLVGDPIWTGGYSLRLVPTGDEWGADQSAAHPDMRAALEAVMVQASRGAPLPGPSSTATGGAGLSPEEDEALRSLGYVE